MKKRLEFCPRCNKETTTRFKKKSYKAKKRGESYATVSLPPKCLTCNHTHGSKPIRRGQKKQHISF